MQDEHPSQHMWYVGLVPENLAPEVAGPADHGYDAPLCRKETKAENSLRTVGVANGEIWGKAALAFMLLLRCSLVHQGCR